MANKKIKTVKKINSNSFEIEYTNTQVVSKTKIQEDIKRLKNTVKQIEEENGIAKFKEEIERLEELLLDIKKAK